MVKKSEQPTIKTDRELVEELRTYIEAMVAKAAELRSRGMIMSLGLDNGSGLQGKVELLSFRVDKIMDEFVSERVRNQQNAGRPQ
jgi:hypothetical protein